MYTYASKLCSDENTIFIFKEIFTPHAHNLPRILKKKHRYTAKTFNSKIKKIVSIFRSQNRK